MSAEAVEKAVAAVEELLEGFREENRRKAEGSNESTQHSSNLLSNTDYVKRKAQFAEKLNEVPSKSLFAFSIPSTFEYAD